LSYPYCTHWNMETPVTYAIANHHCELLRVLLEYGCKLPPRLGVPEWARQLNEEVTERRSRCRAAVVQISGIARFRRRTERDTLRIVAHYVAKTQRSDEWCLPGEHGNEKQQKL
jgi:hypothetical protein